MLGARHSLRGVLTTLEHDIVYFITIQKSLLGMSASINVSSSVRTCLKIVIGFVVEWRRLQGFYKRMTCLINLTLMSVTFTTHANLNYIFLVQKNIWNGALWNSTFICRELPVSLVINRRSQVSQCELIGKKTGPQRRERKRLETICMSNAFWLVEGNLSQWSWRNHLSCC